MKIVIAPDSFKESLTALQAARAIERGFRQVFFDAEYALVPMADGGEGTCESLVAAIGGELIECSVKNPLGEPCQAHYALVDNGHTAIIEMAQASGLEALPLEQRNPMLTTTYGTGELIRHALDRKCQRIIIGLGGSATCDSGIGALTALGIRFLDHNQQEVPLNGSGLSQISHIDTTQLDPRLAPIPITIACDVDSPLIGPEGASATYAPQKGATPEQVQQLEQGLQHFSSKVKELHHHDISTLPGAGAAGGLAAGLIAFLQAEMRPGVGLVAELVNLDHALHGASLVVTGEGAINTQTLRGKTPVGVAAAAAHWNIPVIALAGSLSPDYEQVHVHHIHAVTSIVPGPITLEQALQNAELNLVSASQQIAQILNIGMQL